jgi:hypothetical protein
VRSNVQFTFLTPKMNSYEMLTGTNSKAFHKEVIALPSGDFVSADHCVFHAPPGFSSKPSLSRIYGHELSELFQRILSIPDASSTDAFDHLQQLSLDPATTMSAVTGVYSYLHEHFSSG